ncbi:MAG: ABC transporter ATP-binding protein/permease [Lachnospiraceae bacterium]|nr:ABC transporter ATP-binding protein/permease [Lachnospiraceae bacterium]
MIYKKLKTYVPERLGFAFCGMILALVAAALSTASYFYLHHFLQKVIVDTDMEGAVSLAGRIVVLLIANVIVYFLALWATHILAFRLETNLKKQGIRHLMDASFTFYDNNESGRIRKIIDDNTALTHSSVAHLIPDLTTAVFVPIMGIPLAFYVDWRMGVLFTVSFLSGMLFIRNMMGDRRFMEQYMASSDKMNAGAVEYVRGIPVLKIFRTSVQSLSEFYRSVTTYADLALQYSLICRGWYVIFQVFYNAVFLVTLFFGYGGAAQPRAFLAKFLFYALFNGVLYLALNKVMYLGMHVYQATSCIEKIETLFREMEEKKLPAGQRETMEKTDIAFRDVTFGYGEKKVVEHLSLRLEAGKTYALVGASGSGKSTLARLVSGFYRLDGGQILIGGHDIVEYSEQARAGNIANVFQDAFKKSIFENVKVGRPGAGRDEVMEALHLAQCDEILDKMEKREYTVIGSKGVHLSGGEVQRITIARAILKDAKIVILDEASAAADPENEYELQKAFSNLMRGKTVIMIAHRLSSIIGVDEILVIDEGRVIERGSHRQLMAHDSVYKKLQEEFMQANEWRVTA